MDINLIFYLLLGITSIIFILLVIAYLHLANRISNINHLMQAENDDAERTERMVRQEMAENRKELTELLRQNREELNSAVDRLTRVTLDQLEVTRKSLEDRLGGFQNFQHQEAESLRTVVNDRLNQVQRDARDGRNEQTECLNTFRSNLQNQLQNLTQMHTESMETLRQSIETRLTAIQHDNTEKLEQMRMTVDEKLHNTLEQRLGESFKQVSERLEMVHNGLGEMRTLASGVGDLKRVLSNVKVRGTLGEIQLENLLEQMLSQDQYAKNVQTRPDASERVEFAVKLPGTDEKGTVWLPIDAKFPVEDYQRLLEAQEAGDIAGIEQAGKALETRIKNEAKSIQSKYIAPPYTTDFGLLFLPIEGLYAEVIRRPGLFETLQRDYRITVTGPTTLTAILNSLQMGFRTLAIQQRSGEVWNLLGAVKTEFGKFGDVLAKTRKKLDEARNSIDSAEVRTRAIGRKLNMVETLEVTQAQSYLADLPEMDGDAEQAEL